MTMCRAQEANSHDLVVVLGSMVPLMFRNSAACMRLSTLGMHCLIGPAGAGLSRKRDDEGQEGKVGLAFEDRGSITIRKPEGRKEGPIKGAWAGSWVFLSR